MNTMTQQDGTKHATDCGRVFNRYDAACPRCQELKAGAAPRQGWQGPYFSEKAHREAMWKRGLDEHFAPNGPHAKGLCGPVCTFGDW